MFHGFDETSVGDAHDVEEVIARYEEDVDCYLNHKTNHKQKMRRGSV